MNFICCIFNVAPHYNSGIYERMDREIGCDFFIGDRISTTINLMDYQTLKGFRKVLKNRYIFGNFYWQEGALDTITKSYQHYIISGEPFCLSTWMILIYCKLFNKKTYLWSHGWYGDETQLKRLIKSVFFKLSSKVFLYGEYAKKLMIEEGFSPEKMVVIYNSLNDKQLVYHRSKLEKNNIYEKHFNNAYPILIYVGRIQQAKKIELILKAMFLLKKETFYCNLILIGDNIDDFTLENKISAYDLDEQIWLYGPCFDEGKLSNLIYNADLCVSPGNVGLTAMHALTYGTPVLTHNNFINQMPEFEAIVPWETGIFFEENSEIDLSIKIREFLNFVKKNKDQVTQNCFEVIDKKYNTLKQIKILKENLV